MGCSFFFKLPLPNGSYHNGLCRALWAVAAMGKGFLAALNKFSYYQQLRETLDTPLLKLK